VGKNTEIGGELPVADRVIARLGAIEYFCWPRKLQFTVRGKR
jgi:hypothetical protein